MAINSKKDTRAYDCAYCRREVDHRKLGHELRAEREKRGLSQKEVAYTMGYTPTHICDLELGRRPWTAAKVLKFLAAVRGVKP